MEERSQSHDRQGCSDHPAVQYFWDRWMSGVHLDLNTDNVINHSLVNKVILIYCKLHTFFKAKPHYASA